MADDNNIENIEQDSVDGTINIPESARKPSKRSQDEVDPPNVTALRKAITSFDSNTIDDLAKKGLWTADTILDSQKFWNPLHELISQYASVCEAAHPVENPTLQKKFEDCLALFIENGVSINEEDTSRNTPLHLLCQHYGVDAAIQVLLASGSKVNAVNANEQTALHLAVEDATVKEVEALLAGGADPNMMERLSMAPLHYAVKYRRTGDVIKALLSCGAAIDLQAEVRHKPSGPTALHVAVRNGRKDNLKILLEQGANPDVEDSSGQTPLHLAAAYDITATMTLMLIQAGASLDKKDVIYGETPLHKAIKRNVLKNVKVLCARGASLAEPDLAGESPMHRAAISCNDLDIWVALLSAKQADIRIRNATAQTVLDRAGRSSNKIAVNILKQAQG